MKENNSGLVIGLAVMLLGVVLIGGPMLLGHPPLHPSDSDKLKMANPENTNFTPNTLANVAPPATSSPAFKTPGVANQSDHGDTSAAQADMIATNNKAVKLISDKKMQDAIDVLEPLLKKHLDYGLARDNLAVAYNNLALQQRDSPRVALDALWKAYCLDAKEPGTQENIASLLTVLTKNPKNFQDRMAMGDAQATEDCLSGAYAEYKLALTIHPDAACQAKLNQIIAKARESGDDNINGAFYVKMALRKRGPDTPAEATTDAGNVRGDVDFGPYMARLQHNIKSHWFPPRKNASTRLQITFKVNKDGTISNAHVTKSTGEADEDAAGMQAIKALGKDPLPPGADDSVDIQFNFDYNVYGNDKTKAKKPEP